MKYAIAILLCILVFVVYLIISTAMEWKHGGGYIALALLFGVISWIWKSMTSKDEEKSDTAEIKSDENI